MRLSRLCILLASALLCTEALASGGDDFQENRYASEYQPAALPAFASGKVGVLPATYWRIYYYLAYQASRGKALTPKQLDALSLNRWNVGNDEAWSNMSDNARNGIDGWNSARKPLAMQWHLPLDLPLDNLGLTKDSENFVNCPADAFNQASATLASRLKAAGGKADAWHKQWLQGQDAVFANCAEAREPRGAKPAAHLPPPLSKDAPEWLQYDVAYQTAAANFYARNFDTARAQFQAIAAQPKSPWQPLGAYLAARTLIRKASLELPLTDEGKPGPERLAALAQARKEMEVVSASYAPAKQLLSLVEARLNPTERIATIARLLEKEPFNEGSARLLSDYLRLLDGQSSAQMYGAKEPLTAWIGSMQAYVHSAPGNAVPPEDKISETNRVQAMATVRKVWLKQSDPLWLAPLLNLAKAGELTPAERKAAAAVAPSHVLYLTIQYHLDRLAIAEKQPERADKAIAALLAAQGKSMPTAAVNRFLSMKMTTAATREDFLAAALRTPDDVTTGTPITEVPAQPQSTDADFAQSVLRFLSLAELKALVKHPTLTPTWKANLQEIIFTRALIYNDETSALELLDTMARSRKTTAHLYARYKAAKPGAERRLAGMLILVNTPEFNPSVIGKDGVSKYWGCKLGGSEGTSGNQEPPRYLSAASLADAEKEQQQLLNLPLRTEFIAPVLLEWAGKKQKDEEAPKALHFLVASTRMECPYGTAKPEKEQLRARYSRQAFDILHKVYPNSSWTADTKYFF
ncbi:MAG: hypothetical protein ACJ8GW_18945 [Massilia sp.]